MDEEIEGFMKIIFLDFDGVINNEPYLKRVKNYRSFDPESIDQLNRVLKETGASIVVSSTWRYMYKTVEELDGLLTLHGLPSGSVIGLTPYKMSSTRGQEILFWLNDNPSCTEWVAIDDSSDMEPLPQERVVKTEWTVGLQAEHADKMIEILKKE